MYLCNKERYGYLNVPAKPHHTLEDDRLNFVHIHLESRSKKRSFALFRLAGLLFFQCRRLLRWSQRRGSEDAVSGAGLLSLFLPLAPAG